MVRWLCLLLLGVGLVTAKWRDPVNVVEEQYEIEFLKNVAFTDNMTKRSYLVWIKPSDFSANLRIVEPDGTCRDPIKINTDQRVVYEMQVAITGAHDGKHIFIGFLGSRTTEPITECSAVERRGCTDVYYIETEDGGLTWTKPIAVPRHDINDPYNRAELQIIVNWVNLRVWLLYKLVPPEDPLRTRLMLTTRAPKSTVFSNEVELALEPGAYMKFFLNYEKDTPLLSMFWRGANEKGYLAISRNSGITWTKPQPLTVCDGSDDMLLLHSGNNVLPQHQFALCKNVDTVYVKMSADLGNTWTRSVDLPAEPLILDACVNSARTAATGSLMWLYKPDPAQTTLVATRLSEPQLVQKNMRKFESLMQYSTCTFTGSHQINVWSLFIDDSKLVISLDINDNIFDQ